MTKASLLIGIILFFDSIPLGLLLASNDKSAPREGVVQRGIWGGPHISMEVTESGAKISYDCAHGTIDQQMILNPEGCFDFRGTHVREIGGPVRPGYKPDRHSARYTGRIEGNTMTLVVTLTDTGETAGTFTLKFGQQAELYRCA